MPKCLWDSIYNLMNLGHQIKAKLSWRSVPLTPGYFPSDEGIILKTRHHMKNEAKGSEGAIWPFLYAAFLERILTMCKADLS